LRREKKIAFELGVPGDMVIIKFIILLSLSLYPLELLLPQSDFQGKKFFKEKFFKEKFFALEVGLGQEELQGIL
jgi:hypothetical protein